ncbi:zinc finger BED domain-containing protein 4-like [Watersipora subatra]|uniref:zinc finger BED domain-containing protein 4-like n=1 Tax=Watersipora subatra TaxID=2589382 RepID=UPI00355AEAF8
MQCSAGERIAGVYSEIKVSYGIQNKVIAICTDNGLNVVKAISLPEFPSNEPADEEISEDEMDEDHDTGGDDIRDEDLDAMNRVLSVTQHHVHCFCHTVQLVVGDGLKKCSKTVTHVLAKVNAIINHTRNSVISSELLECNHINKLQSRTATRWNSQLKALNTFLDVPEDLMPQLDTRTTFTRADKKVAEEIRAILQPFKAATEQAEGDYHTGGQVIPIVKLLRHHLECLQCEYPNHHLVNALQESVEKRLVQYEHDDLFILCSSLDPRFKLVWCTKTESEYGETLLKSKIEDLVTLPSPSNDATEAPAAKKTKGLFSTILTNNSYNAKKISGQAIIDREVKEYLAEDLEPELSLPNVYWKNCQAYPNLRHLAELHMPVLASSAPVERLFSQAGQIFRADRSKLTDANFERLMFLRSNKHLL